MDKSRSIPWQRRPDTVRGNRQFLARATAFLRDAGIRQFLDIGSGLPSSPNVHEIARQDGEDARVVYVDHDPVVFVHTDSVMAKDDAVRMVQADLRDVDEVLGQASQTLDFNKPAGLMFVGVLHHILDSEDPAGIVGRYLSALAAGSYLVISHSTDQFSPEKCARTPRWPTAAGLCLSRAVAMPSCACSTGMS